MAGTTARFKANTLGRTARFELSIEARSGDRIGPKSKSYFVDLHPPAPDAQSASRDGSIREHARSRAALEAYDPHAHDEKVARARAEIAAKVQDPNLGVRPFRF